MKTKNSPRRTGIFAVIVCVLAQFLLAVFQSTVGHKIGFFGVTAQYTLALAVCAAFYKGPIVGAVCGLAGGVFTEAIGSTGITLLPLFYTVICWVVGAIEEEKKEHRGAEFLRFCVNLASAALAGGLATLVMIAINSTKPSIQDAIVYIVLPEALNTAVLGILIGAIFFAAEKITSHKKSG